MEGDPITPLRRAFSTPPLPQITTWFGALSRAGVGGRLLSLTKFGGGGGPLAPYWKPTMLAVLAYLFLFYDKYAFLFPTKLVLYA